MKNILTTCFLILLSIFSASSKDGNQSQVDSLETILKNSNEDSARAGTYIALCNLYGRMGNYAKATDYANQARLLSEKIHFKKGIANALSVLGFINNKQSDYSQALRNDSAALSIQKELRDKNGIADCYDNIGGVFYELGNYPEAIKNTIAALKINEETGDQKKIATSYSNIGLIYYNQQNFKEAFRNDSIALAIRIKTGDEKSIAESYHSIAGIYYEQNNFAEALKNTLPALQMNQKTGDKLHEGTCYNDIGLIYSAMGNFAEALKNLFASLHIDEEIGNKEGIANSYNNIGSCYGKQGKYKEALIYLHKGLLLARDIGSKGRVLESYQHIATAYAEMKDYKNAYAYYQQYSGLKDSLINEKNNNRISEITARYETGKKDDQIKLLAKDTQLQQEEIDKQKSERNSFIASTVLLLLLVFGIVSRYRFKQKANKELSLAYTNLKTTQQQLVEREKMYAFGIMAARVAHEIQNPINFVNNFSELSEDLVKEIIGAENDQLKNDAAKTLSDNLKKVRHHGERADKIVKQLLEHTRAGTAQEFFERH
jgi:two-component system NtrC family sensor kinase